MKYLTVIALYVFFWLMAILSGPYGLLSLLWDRSIIGRISQTNDRTTAAMLPFGWNGKSTVSRECGDQLNAGTACRFCRIVCAVLSYRLFGRWPVLDVDHCQKEARAE